MGIPVSLFRVREVQQYPDKFDSFFLGKFRSNYNSPDQQIQIFQNVLILNIDLQKKIL